MQTPSAEHRFGSVHSATEAHDVRHTPDCSQVYGPQSIDSAPFVTMLPLQSAIALQRLFSHR